jgi:hypothetical protein
LDRTDYQDPELASWKPTLLGTKWPAEEEAIDHILSRSAHDPY